MLTLERKTEEQIYLYPKEGTEQMTAEEFFGGSQICIELCRVKGEKAQLSVYVTQNI